MAAPLIEVRDLKKYYTVKKPFGGKKEIVHALDGVSFQLNRGEVLGVVGESGCGKSTLGRTLIRLIAPSAGEVIYDGQNILALNDEQMRQMRRKIQIVFQDPYASLNPRMTVREIIRAPLDAFQIGTKPEREEKVLQLMDEISLSRQYLNRYPHEFSGGQRQRIVIARALILEPEFIVCDEPVSALDVSVQSQVLNLLQDLREKHDLTYLFISHNLSVVHHISDRIAVMYLGKIVELASKKELFRNPLHPYTKALLDALPQPDVNQPPPKAILKGEIPSPIDLPSGCSFRTRCTAAQKQCAECEQTLTEVTPGHWVACCQCRP